MKRLFASILILTTILSISPAAAVEPGEILADPALEARARALSAEIRCLVCQNQSIDESDAELAHELRLLVRERLLAGDGDAAIKDYLVSRYGDFVLFRPPLKPATYLLWFGPFLLLAGGLLAAALYLRSRRPDAGGAGASLSEDEEAQLEKLMGELDSAGNGAGRERTPRP